MADPRQRFGQQRQLARNDRIALGNTLSCHRADRHAIAIVANEGEIGNPGDVDEPRRRASRIASMGISVCPPAMTRAPSSAASSPQASLTLLGRT